jgi:hypothetical protein
MAHYAFLDSNNIVTQVIVGKDENEDGVDWEVYYGEKLGQICKRTSYNTTAGQHLLGGTPFRKNYAGLGYTYDPDRDAFIAPKPFESWILNEDSCLWEPPVPYPSDGAEYVWNEATTSWQLVENGA